MCFPPGFIVAQAKPFAARQAAPNLKGTKMKLSQHVVLRVKTLGLETFNSSIARPDAAHGWEEFNFSSTIRKMIAKGQAVELGKLDTAKHKDTWGRSITTKLMRYSLTETREAKQDADVLDLIGWRSVYPQLFIAPPTPSNARVVRRE